MRQEFIQKIAIVFISKAQYKAEHASVARNMQSAWTLTNYESVNAPNGERKGRRPLALLVAPC